MRTVIASSVSTECESALPDLAQELNSEFTVAKFPKQRFNPLVLCGTWALKPNLLAADIAAPCHAGVTK